MLDYREILKIVKKMDGISYGGGDPDQDFILNMLQHASEQRDSLLQGLHKVKEVFGYDPEGWDELIREVDLFQGSPQERKQHAIDFLIKKIEATEPPPGDYNLAEAEER